MSCVQVYDFTAIPTVQAAHSTILPLAISTFAAAQQQAAALASFTIQPIDFQAEIDHESPGPVPVRPQRPTLAGDMTMQPVAPPPAAPEFDGNGVVLEATPTFNTPAPTLQFQARPDPLDVQAPSAPAPAPDRELPVEPEYSLPAAPDLETILVPLPPSIEIDEFTDTAPEIDALPTIVETWHFSPQQYVSDLLDKVKAKISGMLDGGTGLPTAVQQALWARARARVDVEVGRALQEATDDFAARGFSEPNGILAHRLQQVRQDGQNQRNTLARDIIVAEADLEQKNLQFSVQQGIAFEQVVSALHMQYQQLELQGAQFLLDSSIRVFEARRAQIQLAFEIFVAKAGVYKTRIEAELAKVEIYRAEVEAAKVRGEINDQLVRRHESQIRAVQALAEFYNARVRAFLGQVEADTAKIEAFRAETQAYAEIVRAKSAEFDGYRAGIEAETAKVGVYEVGARAFASRVSAVSESNRIKLEAERLNIQQHEARLRTHEATLRNIGLLLQTEQARLQSIGVAHDANARMYAADGQVEQSISAAYDRRYGLQLQRAQGKADVALKNGEIRVQENAQLTGLQLQALQTASQVLAQLAAGALSAVNYSASIGFSQSASTGCSTNYSIEG